MIICVTPNPALDRTFEVTELRVGEVQRATASRVDPGGKGVNISRALLAHNVPTMSVFPAGGQSGAELVSRLNLLDLPICPVATAGETRSNLTVVDGLGVTAKINPPGAALSPAEEAALLGAVKDLAASQQASETIIVGAGSLPLGFQPDFYCRLVEIGKACNISVAIDSSGVALAKAVTSGGIFLLKPNLEELLELCGKPLRTIGEVRTACLEIIAQGNEAVLVTLGAAGGLLATAESWAWAGGPALVPRSTVGAGDVSLAGFLAAYQRGHDFSAALRHAIAWGRAATLQPGTAAPQPADIELGAVTLIESPALETPLAELFG
ncbi:MAG: 1-phosphofructokinase family hexose kinase [Cellulomonadaceae bacterium]|jgi:1-phosphofructokinase|nr:1-phosphofructokinase family hexose kinase [Cellulomonadaceae bacterium]